jgi:hypothetical protein
MAARRELYGRAATSYEISAHTHIILVGFVMMMILGVALWLFPRPGKDDERYQPRLASVADWLLALGTAACAMAELSRASAGGLLARWTIVAASAAQVAGLVVFFYTMWPRIRAAGSGVRESRGERFWSPLIVRDRRSPGDGRPGAARRRFIAGRACR